MAEKKVSELPVAVSLDGTDLIMVAQENSSSSSDYISMKTTAADIADEFNTELTYNDLNTTDKTIVGSINEVKGMVEANPSGSASTALTAIKINGVNYKIEDTGSIVRAFQVLNTGSEIGSVTVDNQETKFYVGNLNNLGDVTLTSPSDGQVLKYDGTNNIWINGTGGSSVGDLDDLGDVTLTTPTNGQILKYDSTNQVWVNDDESGGSGGHTILDNSGTALTQRDDLQFIGAYVNDDNTNEITKVNVVREMTKAQFDLLSNDEKVGLIRTTDENDGAYSSLNYSTIEQKTSQKWIDGSDVYQRTFTGTIDSDGETEIADFINKKIIGVDGWFSDSNDALGMSFGYFPNSNTWSSALHINPSHKLMLMNNSALYNGNYYITVKYIKTT